MKFNFLFDKILVVSLLIIYGLFYFVFKNNFIEQSQNVDFNFYDYVNSTIGILSIVLTLVSLYWVDDARQTIKKYGKKNKNLTIVNLINRVVSTDTALNSDLMCDLLAELINLTSVIDEKTQTSRNSKSSTVVETKATDNEQERQKKIIFQKTNHEKTVLNIINIIYENVTNNNSDKLSKSPHLKILLLTVKNSIEDVIKE